jgi:hypothetical protein
VKKLVTAGVLKFTMLNFNLKPFTAGVPTIFRFEKIARPVESVVAVAFTTDPVPVWIVAVTSTPPTANNWLVLL